MVNATLVAEGYAQVATYPPDVRYVDKLLELQREAGPATVKGLTGHQQAVATSSCRVI